MFYVIKLEFYTVNRCKGDINKGEMYNVEINKGENYNVETKKATWRKLGGNFARNLHFIFYVIYK